MQESRIILHVDMDAFFASVEQLANPGLRGKAVMVCGGLDTRTVVSAATYEAREYGVHSGMPLAVARVKCPHGIFIEGDPEKYVCASLHINHILQEFTPRLERFSIDESFLDVSHTADLFGGGVGTAKRIKRRIFEETGLVCSVGVAPNKILAKVASKLDKPDGLTVLMEEDIATKLHPLPIEKLFGVGGQTARKLHQLGVDTIGQLAQVPEAPLRKAFGVVGPLLREAANGRDSSPVVTEDEEPPVKSVGNDYTLDRDTRKLEIIDRVLLALCSKVGRRLRRGGHSGRTVALKVRFSDFTTITRNQTAKQSLDLDKEIYDIAREMFGRLSRRDPVRLLGVSVSTLVHGKEARQPSLFDYAQWGRYRRAIGAVDKVRDKFGERTLVWARLLRR